MGELVMIKLLVNAPTGLQQVIEIDKSGGYFDRSRVLWDERKDGPMPEIECGAMIRVDGKLVVSEKQREACKAVSDVIAAKLEAQSQENDRLAKMAAQKELSSDDVQFALQAIIKDRIGHDH